MNKNPHNKHDVFFKEVLSTQNAQKSITQAFFSIDVKKEVDWETLEIAANSYVFENKSQMHGDILLHAKLQKTQDSFFCIIEHQSSADKKLFAQILQYILLLFKRYLKQYKKYPIVVGLGVYTSKNLIAKNTTSHDSFFENCALYQKLSPYPITLIDISKISDQELLNYDSIGIALVILKYGVVKDFNFVKWMHQNPEIIIKLSEKDYAEVAFVYMAHCDESATIGQILEVVDKYISNKKPDIMSALDKYVENGRQEKILEIVKNMLKDGLPLDKIKTYTHVSEELLMKLIGA